MVPKTLWNRYCICKFLISFQFLFSAFVSRVPVTSSTTLFKETWEQLVPLTLWPVGWWVLGVMVLEEQADRFQSALGSILLFNGDCCQSWLSHVALSLLGWMNRHDRPFISIKIVRRMLDMWVYLKIEAIFPFLTPTKARETTVKTKSFLVEPVVFCWESPLWVSFIFCFVFQSLALSTHLQHEKFWTRF